MQGYNDLSVWWISQSGPLKLSHLFGFSVSGTLSRLQIFLHEDTGNTRTQESLVIIQRNNYSCF